MEINDELKGKIEKIQLLEQRMQMFLAQKQSFQTQLLEVENALTELGKVNGEAYKIVGNVMVLMPKEEIEKDLNNKKEVVNIRIKSLEKQEDSIKDDVSKLQEEVMKEMKE
ncbi:MAG TPA: prefoldin subunit beta [Candidatus Nanoarchaeia archaeon]|nr:prefoldin subunit beta [Candidatus Nanoarchaeia archaeon]